VTDFVLIHGTTQGPAGWDRLVAALAARGHRGIAVDLAADEQLSVAGYAEAASSQVPADVRAPVVVAHSGAGPVLPGVARLLGARRQVWLAAIVPDGRRSLLAEIRSGPAEIFSRDGSARIPPQIRCSRPTSCFTTAISKACSGR
jgi:hypothetical protein